MKGIILPEREKISINVARIKRQGLNFEVVIEPDKAMEYRKHGNIDISDVLLNKGIFTDAKKGNRASETEMERIFETRDDMLVAEKILKEGEIQLSAEYRNKIREEKRKRVIAIISRNGVDPKTHFPHPSQRIENAFEEAKVRVDEHKSAEYQIQDILKQILSVLPIKFELHELEIIIPARYAAKCYSVLKAYGSLLRDEWQNDGSLYAVIEIPAGLKEEFFDRLNSMTHGDIQSKILKTR